MKFPLLLLLLTISMAESSFAQDLIIAPRRQKQLVRHNANSGATTILFQERNIVDLSANYATGDVYAIDVGRNEVIVVSTGGDVASTTLPIGGAESIRYANDNMAYISFDDESGYAFDAISETFQLVANGVTSPLFLCGDYILHGDGARTIRIRNTDDYAEVESISIPFGNGDLKAALFNSSMNEFLFVTSRLSTTTVFAYSIGDPNSLRTLASFNEEFHSFRPNQQIETLYFFASEGFSDLAMSTFDWATATLTAAGTIPSGGAADVIDLGDEAVSKVVLNTDLLTGWILDYSFSGESFTRRLDYPLARPTGVRYSSLCECVYIVNRSSDGSPGGSVFRFDLDDMQNPKVIIEPTQRYASEGLRSFEVDRNGHLLFALDGTTDLYRRTCDTCQSERLALSDPFILGIGALATSNTSDTIYLLNQGDGLFAFDPQSNVVVGKGRLDETDGGELRVDNYGKYAYGFEAVNQNLEVLDMRSGTRSRIVPNSVSCLAGISRQDPVTNKIFGITYSHQNGDIKLLDLDLAAGTSTDVRDLPFGSGPVAIITPRISSTIEETFNEEELIVKHNQTEIEIVIPRETTQLIVSDLAGKKLLQYSYTQNYAPNNLLITRDKLAQGAYVVSAQGVQMQSKIFVIR